MVEYFLLSVAVRPCVYVVGLQERHGTGAGNTQVSLAVIFISTTASRMIAEIQDLTADGKWRGWTVVLAGFILHVPMMGFVMSFGELLHPMMEIYDANMSTLSWVGSLAFGTAYVANPLSTPLYNRFPCRWVSVVGVVVGSLGLFATSYVQTPWFLYFTYSLPFGLGTNLCYNPPLILAGDWFPVRYHVLATCTLVAGIPFGSLVMNPLSEMIIRSFGLPGGLRIISLLVLVSGVPCCLALQQPPPEDATDDPATHEPLIPHDTYSKLMSEVNRREASPPKMICSAEVKNDLWSDPVFILYIIGMFTKAVGYVFPFVHLVSFMLSIGLDSSSASIVMTIKGFADMLGRLLAGVFGGHVPFPLIQIYAACTGVMAITTFMGVFASTFTHMAVYASSIGFCNGVYNSLLFSTTTALFKKDVVSDAWKYSQVPPGIAIIVGPGIAGFIYDMTQSYTADFEANTLAFLIAMVVFVAISVIEIARNVIEEPQKKPSLAEMFKAFIGIKSRDDDAYDDEIYVIVCSESESDE